MQHKVHIGVAFGSKANNQGLWETGFVVTKGYGRPWFLWEDNIGLFESFHGLPIRLRPGRV